MKDGDKNNDGRIDFDGEGLARAGTGRGDGSPRSFAPRRASSASGAGRGGARFLPASRGPVLCSASANSRAPSLRGWARPLPPGPGLVRRGETRKRPSVFFPAEFLKMMEGVQ